MSERIIVGMSGGVDSSVAALLLKDMGYDVLGVFMRNWEEDDESGLCTATKDYEDVRAVCDAIDIPYYTVNFTKQYWERVFAHFLDEYRRGRTPNPDILCNREIKFGAFLDFARGQGVQRVATGHFARTDGERLLRGVDDGKDQSYFLHLLTRNQLSRALFPLGGMTKAQVRGIAAQAGLPTAHKKDSTGVCFIGERDFRAFLKQFIPAQKGVMMTSEGVVAGEHDGVLYYTIGQRKGLGIGGNGVNAPWYVTGKDVHRNILYISQGDGSELYDSALIASDAHWIAGAPPEEGERLSAKIRYRQPDQACSIVMDGGCMTVRFEHPQRAITPGQSVVFYRGEECLGGAVIDCAGECSQV